MRRCVAIGVFVLLLAGPAVAQQATSPSAPDEVQLRDGSVAKRVPPQPGDVCRVCNRPVDEDDAVYQVKGRRIAIHTAEMQDDLLLQLGSLVAQLEPRGALFDNRDGTGLSDAWLYFGLYVLAGLVFGAMCAQRALHAGYNPLTWFGWGLLFNAAGYVVLLTRPKREAGTVEGVPRGLGKVATTYSPVVCECGAENHPSARQCGECGKPLTPRCVSEVERVRKGAS